MANRPQSPTSPLFVLGSNDDQLERALARAARAAANRRKAAIVTDAPPPPPDDPCLSTEQIIDLFQNCIKLASENKINQKNTWDLKLIDHLSEVIKVKAENDIETNFQKASCTLEAGVKIYSVRVDSVHAEAYKVLSRINRAGLEDEQETTMEDGNVTTGQDRRQSKKESERKISPMSTLESAFEALNIKKFDVAFTVDPLYHQTSAQFDEGGAKGLLLNNLGVYGGCQVLFDSFEVPGKCRSSSLQNNALDLIDLSFAKESVEQMVTNMRSKNEISPTLKEILYQFEEDNQQPSQAFNICQNSDLETEAFDDNEVELDTSFGNHDTWTFDHDDVDISVAHENMRFGDPTFESYHEDNNSHAPCGADVDDRFEKVSTFLLQGLGLTSKQNAWAGPDHWKYGRPKGSEDAPATESRPITTKKKNHTEVDLDFTASLNKEFPDIFSPPKNFKSLLLPANKIPRSNLLPEDCHYQPEELVKLFFLPNVSFIGKRKQKNLTDDNSWEQSNDFDEALPSWDNESVLSGQYNYECVHSTVEDLDTLVSQPRQVSKIEVQYDRTSKRVDVHALKETLWDHMQESIEVPQMEVKDPISFKHILATFPVNCRAAVPEDISPHLCFICLLHLANEHGLSIIDSPGLDDLSIHLPSRLNSDRVIQPLL